MFHTDFIDEEGKQYGRWKVLRFAGLTHHRNATFECECSCPAATRKVVLGYSLRQGRSRSCGCLQRELAAQRLASVQNYKESAKPRAISMWASGIRPRSWKKQHGKAQVGQDNPSYKHGRRCRGMDEKAYKVWLKKQKAVVENETGK
jgi:hypothetical protein